MLQPCSSVGSESNCRSRGHEFHSDLVPYFGAVWSWNNSPPSLFQEGLLTVSSESMHKVLVNCLVNLAQEKCVVRWTNHFNMTIAVDWDVKPLTKQNTDISEFWVVMGRATHGLRKLLCNIVDLMFHVYYILQRLFIVLCVVSLSFLYFLTMTMWLSFINDTKIAVALNLKTGSESKAST